MFLGGPCDMADMSTMKTTQSGAEHTVDCIEDSTEILHRFVDESTFKTVIAVEEDTEAPEQETEVREFIVGVRDL